ncbi:TPA: phage tail spike protein [Streptococcus suis]
MIYLKDGNIPLNLAYDDDIVQEANSSYQLSFKFPLTDGKWNLLKREVFLLADDLHGEQEFFIFEVKKAKGHVQVYAKQVATLLNYYSINSISVDRVPGQTAMTALAGSIKRNCPFTFFSDIMDRHTFNESNVSVMDALAKDKHSIVGQWGGDLVRDKYQVKLLKNGGIKNESLFMYKKNLSSYEESENINSLKTRLHLKKTIQGQSEGEEDRVIAVTVDSPLINQYSQIYEADIEVNDQDVTDEASLIAYGQRYFSSTLCDLVENSINLDVKGKSDVSVKMFDTVSVFHERFDVDLRLKITSYHFGPMSKRLKSIGFGKVSQSFGSAVAGMVASSVDRATGAVVASFEQKLQKEIDNANRHFDAEFDKRVESINDGIEQAKAEAELYADTIKQNIDAEIDAVNQTMQAQSEEHDRQVADILSKTQSIESLANEAKTDAASAITTALQSKDEAIADARAQVATVSQALNTAKTELQTAIASVDQKARDSQASATALRNDLNLQASKILEQAQSQTDLTNRVTTVETLADGTRSTVAELSRTMNEATQNITSVISRTRTVEDALSQTRTQYETLTQTVNAQTGQIESINRKTADLQSGIDGVRERFESLRIEDNLLLNSSFNENLNQWQGTGVTIVDGKARITGEFNKTKYIYQSIKSQIANDDVSQVYIASLSVKVTNFVGGSINPFLSLYIEGRKNDSTNSWFGATYLTTNRLETINNQGFVQFTTTFKVNVPRNEIKYLSFYIYTRDFTGEVEFEKVSLRRGNIDLGWQPSPEDLRHEIGTYVRNASENSAELSRQIQLADGKAVDAKTYAQQTADVINTRLESLETYKNAEGARVEQYLTASREETARQLTAERTAIATNYVAKSTYDENVRGTTLKLNEIKKTADTAKQNLATYQNTVDRKLEELTSSTQTLDGKINTASAKVDTVAGQIRTEISEVEGKIPTEIGGRNYFSRSLSNYNTDGTYAYRRLPKDTITISVSDNDVNQNTDWCYIGVSKNGYNASAGHYWIVRQGQLVTDKITINGFGFLSIYPKTQDTIDKLFNRYKIKVETGTVATDWSPAPEDYDDELSSVKTTITQTASGVEQLSTSLTTTDSKVTTAEAKIRQLISDVSSKVSQTDHDTLTGRMASAETAITQNAQEISKRLTSTQVDSAISAKGYQTKADVDSNITGRGYATTTVLENKVRETADSFSRSITETRALIPSVEGLATVTALHAVNDTVDSHTRTIGAVGTAGSILDNVSKVTQTAAGLVQEVSGSNGLKTQVSQLAGSYAIQNLTNSGTVLNQLNLNKDGSVKIDGKLVQITGTTYIQDGVISSAKIGSLDAGKITTGTLDAARIKANSIDGSKLVFDQAFFTGLTANEAYLEQLFAKDAFITQVQAVTLSANKISGGILSATNDAMQMDLNTGSVNFFTDSPAIRRSVANLPNQFVKFATATEANDNNFKVLSNGLKTTGQASVTSIGTNRANGEKVNDGAFTGINIYASGPATGTSVVDRIGIHSDVLIVSHSVSEGQRGWVYENYNSSNNDFALRPLMPRGLSNYSSYIGTETHPITRLYSDDVMLNGHRLKGILKDLANRVGKYDGWAADIS